MADFLNQDHDSDSDNDDFRPGQAPLSDDEDAEQPKARRRSSGDQASDEEDDTPSNKNKSAKQGGERDDEDEDDEVADEDLNANGEDEDDDGKGDDLDDEDEEDDEEEEDDRPRKRAKRDRRLQFIDVEAEVDDEEEEDEIEDDEIVADEVHPDDLLDMPAGAENDDRRHRELDRQREIAASMDAEKQAAALREKYGRNRAAVTEVSAIPQHLLLPSVSDPMIWCVRVKPGKEQEILNLIYRRWDERRNSRDPIKITSAFGRGGSAMSGYIYVEATQTEHVYAATDGISFCYPRSLCKIIDIKERPDLLRTTPPKPIEPGMWVRIKRPAKYAGDLAQVDSVEDNGSDVTLKIIPRIDYGLDEDMNGPQNIKRKRPAMTARPPQRLFSEVEARKKMGRFLQQSAGLSRKHFTFHGDQYIDGYLIKDMKVNALDTENVSPTLEEVSKFASGDNEGGENLDLASIAASLKASASYSDFLPGDRVEIYQGEQQGVGGKAIAVHGDIVTIEVVEGPLAGQKIEAPIKGLRKLFKVGDQVKVIGGSKFFDEVGLVVRVVDDRVTMLTNSNNQEITVFSKDLREATDSGASSGLSNYAIKDLVQLDASTVAVVIKVDRESLRIIDQNGTVRTLLPSNISQKIEKRRNAVATDREGSEVRADDTVKEWSGEQRTGIVIHVHRNYLFIWNRHQAENAGMFVARSANVQTVAAKGGKINSLAPDLTKMNPAMQNKSANGGTPMGPPKTFGRDKMIGKTVTIALGPYKGLLGMVKDTTDDKARVELHTKNKVVTVPKTSLRIKDPITGQAMGFGRGRGGGPPGGRFGMGTPGGSRVPDFSGGSRTPAAAANGGRTPAWGMQSDARTPAWAQASNGGRTPAQAHQGGRTPAWSRENDGSRTAYGGGDGSRTAYGGRTEYGGGGGGSWSASARTPFAGNSGFSGNDDYASGSKTPAWGAASAATPGFSGSRTPAHPSAYNAPTPGASYGSAPTPYNSAPTPGAYAAPTPGAMDGPTPRPYGDYQTPGGAISAPTPGQYPETPGAFAAETPRGYGDDDPRYE